ncbi:MAG: algE [Moraxellaceae bacterium]|nr:algE [Moraxellaceae bacterium]
MLVEKGLQAEIKARQVEPAFAGDGEGITNLVLRPYWFRQSGEHDISAVSAKLYASDDYDADTDVSATRNADRQYAEITELWHQRFDAVDPRRSVRIGIQKINDGSSRWWDTPLTGGALIYGSSLVNGYVAAGSRASFLRTDWDETDPRAEHGWVVAAQSTRQWRQDQFVSVRSLARLDTDPGYAMGETLSRARFEREPTRAIWLAGDLQGERRREESPDYYRYLLELGMAAGEATRYRSAGVADPDALSIVADEQRDIAGLLLRVEGQRVWERDWQWRLGGSASVATGGDGAGDAGYVGTGLTSYRNELFGTQARGHLNGEAMRLEPGNASVAGLHAAVSPRRGHELLLALRSAWRTDAAGDVILGGSVLPGGQDRAIGDCVDVVYSWRQRPFFRERTVRAGGFEGRHLLLTYSHFAPAFADPGNRVSGDVLSLEYFHSF